MNNRQLHIAYMIRTGAARPADLQELADSILAQCHHPAERISIMRDWNTNATAGDLVCSLCDKRLCKYSYAIWERDKSNLAEVRRIVGEWMQSQHPPSNVIPDEPDMSKAPLGMTHSFSCTCAECVIPDEPQPDPFASCRLNLGGGYQWRPSDSDPSVAIGSKTVRLEEPLTIFSVVIPDVAKSLLDGHLTALHSPCRLATEEERAGVAELLARANFYTCAKCRLVLKDRNGDRLGTIHPFVEQTFVDGAEPEFIPRTMLSDEPKTEPIRVAFHIAKSRTLPADAPPLVFTPSLVLWTDPFIEGISASASVADNAEDKLQARILVRDGWRTHPKTEFALRRPIKEVRQKLDGSEELIDGWENMRVTNAMLGAVIDAQREAGVGSEDDE